MSSESNDEQMSSDYDQYISPLEDSGRPEPKPIFFSKDGPAEGKIRVRDIPYSGFCSVCELRLNSFEQSKAHYNGKPHAKKLRKKEEEEAEKNGTRKKSKKKKSKSSGEDEPPKKKSNGVSVAQLYCNACDLTFTSEAHAQDHYLGRNHERVIHGLAPYFQGYFNTSTNKWQRTPPDPRVSTQLLSSELPENMKGKTPHQDKPKIRGKFHCELCNISLTCQLQLESHIAGSRHAKTLKRKESNQEDGTPTKTEISTIKCDICGISVNSPSQYSAHVSSKKHQKLITAKYPSSKESNSTGGETLNPEIPSLPKAPEQPDETSSNPPIEQTEEEAGDPFDPHSRINNPL